jgi:hypothetical protein
MVSPVPVVSADDLTAIHALLGMAQGAEGRLTIAGVNRGPENRGLSKELSGKKAMVRWFEESRQITDTAEVNGRDTDSLRKS